EDTKLIDRLLAELPGILLWAIAGWQRLRDRGHFVQPESSRKLIQDLEDLSSVVGTFVRERCVVGPGLEVAKNDLFAGWQSWCEKKGHTKPAPDNVFARDLLAILPALDSRQRREGGKRTRVWVGIRVRQQHEAEASDEDGTEGEGPSAQTSGEETPTPP